MVFPRAVLDKTLVPQLDLQLEAHLVEFFFSPPFLDVGISGSSCTVRIGLGKLLLGSYVLLFFCLLHAWKTAQLRSSLVCEAE